MKIQTLDDKHDDYVQIKWSDDNIIDRIIISYDNEDTIYEIPLRDLYKIDNGNIYLENPDFDDEQNKFLWKIEMTPDRKIIVEFDTDIVLEHNNIWKIRNWNINSSQLECGDNVDYIEDEI